MNWVKFLAKNILFFLVLWMICIYGVGDFYLSENVVPVKGVSVSEWMSAYYTAGTASAIVGFIFSLLWFVIGSRYTGGSGIAAKHTLLWGVCTILGIGVAFVILEGAQEGMVAAYLDIFFIAPIGYYMNSLFNSAAEVKFIPPMATKIHG